MARAGATAIRGPHPPGSVPGRRGLVRAVLEGLYWGQEVDPPRARPRRPGSRSARPMAGSGRGSSTRSARRSSPWPSTATTLSSAWTTTASRPSNARISSPARTAASPGTGWAAGCMPGRADVLRSMLPVDLAAPRRGACGPTAAPPGGSGGRLGATWASTDHSWPRASAARGARTRPRRGRVSGATPRGDHGGVRRPPARSGHSERRDLPCGISERS